MQSTDLRKALLLPAVAASDGRGASNALQWPPESVSTSAASPPAVAAYSPTATHEPSTAHDAPSALENPAGAASLGSGVSSALHEPPEKVSRRPCEVLEPST